MKTKLLFLTLVLISYVCLSQNTTVLDDNFENYLETHDANGLVVALGDPTSMGDGIDNNDLVLTARINMVTVLTVSSLGIVSLTGIEDFTSLITLSCDGNALTTLNVTQNTSLISLACGNFNALTSLDVTKNILLTHLSINLNLAMTSIDVTKNIALEFLNTQNVPLTSLDVTQNIALEQLQVQSSGLTSLDVSKNVALWDLNVVGNQLTSLDLTNNIVLFIMRCNNNALLELNVKNGYNVNVPSSNFTAINNPGLTCITVDDVAYSDSNWNSIDPGMFFSTDCAALGIDDFDAFNFTIFPNPTKDKVIVNLNLDATYSLVNILGQDMGKGDLVIGDNTLNISRLSKGLYFLNVKTSLGTATKKIIKQ